MLLVPLTSTFKKLIATCYLFDPTNTTLEMHKVKTLGFVIISSYFVPLARLSFLPSFPSTRDGGNVEFDKTEQQYSNGWRRK